MKHLTLVRHAKSSWKDSSLPDDRRPLNGRGKRDAPRVGAWLASEGVEPQLILTSPAKRARGTAKRLAKALGIPKDAIEIDDDLYTFGAPRPVIAALARLDDDLEHVLVVGHNPTWTELVNWLAGLDLDNLPTCGAVGVSLPIDRWADLPALDEPGEHRFTCLPRELE